jgi:hypothetical protein
MDTLRQQGDQLPPLLDVVLIVGFIVTVLFGLPALALLPLKLEKGKRPLYSGGASRGRIGWVRSHNWWISLRIYDEFIVIRTICQVVVLRYEEIERVEVREQRGIFGPSYLQIIHHANVPKTIELATSRKRYIKDIIDAQLAKRSVA